MLPRLSRRQVTPLIILLSLLLPLVFAAPMAAKKNPAGNNGTVKIDRLAFDDHPNNEPHVGCTFEVDFYGFDQGDLWADVTFEAHPPTGHGQLLHDVIFIGGDDNSGGGSEAGLDGSREYDLTEALKGYPVHPQQGYHVKLTINADGSQGADTKHKVFWVGPCDPPSNPPENPPSNPPSNPPGGGDPGGNEPPRGDTKGNSGGSGGVLLPDTGMSAGTTSLLMLVGVMFVGASATLAVVTARRVRHPRR